MGGQITQQFGDRTNFVILQINFQRIFESVCVKRKDIPLDNFPDIEKFIFINARIHDFEIVIDLKSEKCIRIISSFMMNND